MTSLAPRSPRSRSQAGVRRPPRSPSHLHPECPGELEDPLGSPSLGQRSVSLTALQPTIIIQPRMAQLETLEAKMASIEVSLSSTPRRKKNGSISGISVGSSNRHSIPKEFAIKELEGLRNALKDKENIIQNLKNQLGISSIHVSHIRGNGLTNSRDLSEVEKKQAEERLGKLRNETDNKRLTIKNLKLALERLDITDNIDVRIQQAELEYQLGREELNLLTLLEETRALQICLEESAKNNAQALTLYSCVKSFGHASLHAVEILHDPKSPRFGAGTQDSHNSGLMVDWALDGTGLHKGDRLVEVNGKIVLNKTREDLNRLLAAAPDPAQIVLLRTTNSSPYASTYHSPTSEEVAALRSELGVVKERAEETQKAKDGLICDNIRLTHRISYLEEQVAELLLRQKVQKADNIRIVSQKPIVTSLVKSNQNVTNINITSQPPPQTSNELQIFQKGPQVTALVSNIPGLDLTNSSLPVRSRSSMSNVSNTHILAGSPQHVDSHCHGSKSSQQQRHKSPKPKSNQHHHHHQSFVQESSMERSYKQASMIVHELTSKSLQNGHYHIDPNTYEKHQHKNNITASEKYNSTHLLKHYNSRKSASVLNFHSKPPERKIADARSVKSLDFDSDHIDYTSEPTKSRPEPPKKPVRLSLHKTQSLQSVETSSNTHNGSPDYMIDSRKSLKRNHKGETQYISDCKLNTLLDKQKSTNKEHGQKSNGLSGLKWSTFSSSK